MFPFYIASHISLPYILLHTNTLHTHPCPHTLHSYVSHHVSLTTMCTLSTHICAFTPHRWALHRTHITHIPVNKHNYSMYEKCAQLTPHTQCITSYHTPSTYTSPCIQRTDIAREMCHIRIITHMSHHLARVFTGSLLQPYTPAQ